MMESYKIRLRVRENAMPYAFSAPRRVPVPSPTKAKMDQDILPFFTVREDLTAQGLLLHCTRLVITVELRKDILSKIHDGHQGIA